jgi:hypothetical protein
MRITASWFGLRSDRIQIRGAMACADYGMGQLETKPDLMRPMVSGNPWPQTGHLTGQESSSSYMRLPPVAVSSPTLCPARFATMSATRSLYAGVRPACCPCRELQDRANETKSGEGKVFDNVAQIIRRELSEIK